MSYIYLRDKKETTNYIDIKVEKCCLTTGTRRPKMILKTKLYTINCLKLVEQTEDAEYVKNFISCIASLENLNLWFNYDPGVYGDTRISMKSLNDYIWKIMGFYANQLGLSVVWG